MGKDNAVSSAEQLPSGAKFFKCALQVNPCHYSETFRGQSHNRTDEEYINELFDNAIENDISVIAVTDHNNVNGIDKLAEKADARGLHLFPGFELTSSEGVHVLCLFPESTSETLLNSYLGGFGIHDSEPSSKLANASFAEILDKVQDHVHGGISIAAHVTNNGGLFRVLSGQTRIKAWQDRNLLAIQIPGKVEELPQDVRQIIQNKNADYRRESGADDAFPIAVVNAKDVQSPEEIAEPAASCLIKMSEVSIEGLRQAFLDPKSRIRLNSDPPPEQHSELIGMHWEGGFLDGVAVHFNPNLNVLIGGRGAGKSTIIESLRYVLDIDTIGEDAQKAHEGIIQEVLRNGTKISLSVQSYNPAQQKYIIERTIPNPPIVRTETGEVSNLLPQDVLPRIEVYGQHEISELTRSGKKLTRLLDRFVERDRLADGRKTDILSKLAKNRRSILEIQEEIEQIEERLDALPGLEETLKRYQKAGVEDRLKEQSLLVREERILDTVNERMQVFRDCLINLQDNIPLDRAFLSPKALEELPGKDILAKASEILKELESDVEKTASLLEKSLTKAESSLKEVQKGWDERKKDVQAEYEKILRDLQKNSVDGEEFIRLRRKVEELRPLRDRMALLKNTLEEHKESRRELLVKWEDTKAAGIREQERAAKKVSNKLRDRVAVQVTASGNRESLFNLLRAEVGGRFSEAIDELKKVRDLSLPKLVKTCRNGGESLNKEFNIPTAQAERLANASSDVLMRIEELDLDTVTTIKLNTAPPEEQPRWQELKSLSTGQKATAVLLMLLLESEAPLIVDQPEDDLDNRFITEGIVPRMREEKCRRQFIFSTHNANIPVLGDAELILGLKAKGEAASGTACVPKELMGSIDSKKVRELIEEILEGGKAAFEVRRLKYGF